MYLGTIHSTTSTPPSSPVLLTSEDHQGLTQQDIAAVSPKLSSARSASSVASSSSRKSSTSEQHEEVVEEVGGIEDCKEETIEIAENKKEVELSASENGKTLMGEVLVMDTKTTSSFHSFEQTSSLISSSNVDMPASAPTALNTNTFKEYTTAIDDPSPTIEGLAAPDSKDSLEVQLTSVCEDLSDNLSGKDESLEDIKNRAGSVQSNDAARHDDDESDENDDFAGSKQDHNSTDSSFEMVETTNTVEELHVIPSGDEDLPLPPPPQALQATNDLNETQADIEKPNSQSSDEEGPIDVEPPLGSFVPPPPMMGLLPEDLLRPRQLSNQVQDSFDSVASQYSSENVRAEFSRSSSSDEEGPDDDQDVPSSSDVDAQTGERVPIVAAASFDSSSENQQQQHEQPKSEASPETSVSTRQEVTEIKKQMTAGDVSSSEEECVEVMTTSVGALPPPASSFDSEDSPLPAVRATRPSTALKKPSIKKASSTSESDRPAQSSSDDSSETEEDDGGKGGASSSDYDSSSAPRYTKKAGGKKKRPDSFVSDTSSDYDSLSNLDSRARPQSFLLDDEYEVITEEETADNKADDDTTTTTKTKTVDDVASSESSKSGPDVQAATKTDGETDHDLDDIDVVEHVQCTVPSSNHVEVVVENNASTSILPASQDMMTSTNQAMTNSTSPVANTPNSVSLGTLDLDLHATTLTTMSSTTTTEINNTATCELLSVDASNSVTNSVDLAHQSSVIHSNTLEEIDPLAPDGQSPLTRSSDSSSTAPGVVIGASSSTSSSISQPKNTQGSLEYE